MKRLQTEFVPAVGNTMGELHRAGSPLNTWFSEVQRRTGRPQGQGYYIVGGDGVAYAGDNWMDGIGNLLDQGLAAYEQSPPRRDATISKDEIESARPSEAPPGTSILRVFTRIRPVPSDAHPFNQLLGRDHMWITEAEIQEILAAPLNEEFSLPGTLVRRLVVLHLVDNVRGAVWPWQWHDVSRARFTARVASESRNLRTYTFVGDYAKKSTNLGNWKERGQEGKVEGQFTVNTATARLVQLRAIAESAAWFEPREHNPLPPLPAPSGRYPLVTAFTEANDELARQIAPAR